MSRNEIKMLFRQLPFENITDYDLENEVKSAEARIQQKMNDHRLENSVKENYLMELLNPFDLNVCKYFDEDEYNGLRRSSKYHLNVFCMNIRSLPKHTGDLVVINPTRTRNHISIDEIFHQDKYITDTRVIANIMNTYFCEVGRKLQENMPKSGYAYVQYLPDRI